uniref:Putative secreted peptide n=1 Tax=Rhipicephalus pulchellus TaxID=72859 RepID=L7MCI3_RHIPC
MDKTAFVLLLILSNIVPLMAWGSMAQVWYRGPSTRAPQRARSLVEAPEERSQNAADGFISQRDQDASEKRPVVSEKIPAQYAH